MGPQLFLIEVNLRSPVVGEDAPGASFVRETGAREWEVARPVSSKKSARSQAAEIPLERRMSNTPRTLTQLLEAVQALAANHDVGDARDVRVGDVLDAVGRRAYGPFLLLLGVFSISPATIVPGMNWFVAAITLVLTIQMSFGARHPWLPRSLLDAKLARATVRKACAFARPWAVRLDRVFRPRLCFLTEAPFVNLAGLFCTLAALTTFPLGLVPLGPVAPGLAITAVALGLFFRDGVLLLVGTAIVAGAAALAYRLFG
jgi:hypothetical protein